MPDLYNLIEMYRNMKITLHGCDTLDHYLRKMISSITENTCISLKHVDLQNSNQSNIFDLIESACNLFALNLRSVKKIIYGQ